jgi:hypothetical protein
LEGLLKAPTLVITGASLAGGGAAAKYAVDKIEGKKPSEIEEQFLSELEAAMVKSSKSGKPVDVTFGDFTLTIQPTRNRGQSR